MCRVHNRDFAFFLCEHLFCDRGDVPTGNVWQRDGTFKPIACIVKPAGKICFGRGLGNGSPRLFQSEWRVILLRDAKELVGESLGKSLKKDIHKFVVSFQNV